MHFTIVFEGTEGRGDAYSLCFVPNPCWFLGDENVLTLDRSTPELPSNAIRPLLRYLRKDRRQQTRGFSRCIIVVHPDGHGSEPDLARLIADCEGEAITVVSVTRFA